jgi:hypothetical protein
MKVTDHYKLGTTSADVPFVDVNVLRDTRLFVDPSAIRVESQNGYTWAERADKSIKVFFDQVLLCLGDRALHEQGMNSLAEFHEPRETRLGMSATGFDGRGASREIGERIWNSLLTNPLCAKNVALLKRLEDIALFVDDISSDRVSDLTTRIIIEDLIAFTQIQMGLHRGLSADTISTSIQTWDVSTNTWIAKSFTLPRVLIPGRPDTALILVPKRLVHIGLRMYAGGFWSIEAIGAVQDDEAVVLENGRTIKSNKDELKKRPELRKVRPTNISQTERIWLRDERSLIESYRTHVDGSFEPVSDEQIEKKTPMDSPVRRKTDM